MQSSINETAVYRWLIPLPPQVSALTTMMSISPYLWLVIHSAAVFARPTDLKVPPQAVVRVLKLQSDNEGLLTDAT